MKFKQIGRFQEGGPMPAGPGPEAGGGEDPTAQIMQAAQQAVEAQDGQLALQVCQMLLEMMGGGAPGGEEGAGAPPPPEGEPVYRRGGRLVRRIKF